MSLMARQPFPLEAGPCLALWGEHLPGDDDDGGDSNDSDDRGPLWIENSGSPASGALDPFHRGRLLILGRILASPHGPETNPGADFMYIYLAAAPGPGTLSFWDTEGLGKAREPTEGCS